MHILLTNDDGLFAPGLAAIYSHITKFGDVSVVAPAQAKSGAGHSISLEPLVCEKLDITGKFTAFSVAGSPADCVKMAVNGLLDSSAGPIDLVVSGINHGANVGIHVFYSGTVAAAVEAAFYGIPSIAVSATYEEDLDIQRAAACASGIIEQLLPLQSGDVINVNVPALSQGPPKGVMVVPQSTAGFAERFAGKEIGNGQVVFEYTGGAHRDPNVTPADTTSLAARYVTITALQFDMTDYERNRSLSSTEWKIAEDN
jgi:5'-nucleotidase